MSLSPTPARAEMAPPSLAGLAGDPGSKEAIARLTRDCAGSRTKVERKVANLLRSALRSIAAQDFAEASRQAIAALNLDERQGLAWHVLAIAQEKAGQLDKAFAAYEAAIKLLPDETEVAHDLGRLAHRLGHLEIAEKLLSRYLARRPGHVEATNNLACALRDQNRNEEAIALLSELIGLLPEQPVLWNTLGTVLSERGDAEQSLPFYDEALRLDPGFYRALYNRANVRMALGNPRQALEDIDRALAGTSDPGELAVMNMARALILLMVGDLEAGFDTYEVRFDPHLSDAVVFQPFGPRWSPKDDLAGKTLLVYGEQGLGDEVLFANVLADVETALGPNGRMILALEKRLVPLFQRSHPRALIVPHRSVGHMGRTMRTALLPDPPPAIDSWTPIGSLFRRFRRSIEAFPQHGGFLQPDPERVAYWRAVLAEEGPQPKVGVIWKSLKMTGSRVRAFSPFEMWRSVLSLPDIQFVNLQYGDVEAEMDAAREAGIRLWTPPGIDLKNDLDDLAALARALDLVVGSSTATTNIAAACGAEVWVVAGTDAWIRFGTDQIPCYPSARIFQTDRPGEWGPAMDRLCTALAELVAATPDDRPVRLGAPA